MLENHKLICEELQEIYRKKNADYRNSFSKSFKEYGEIMSIIRIEDKLNRCKQLIKNESFVKDESIRDTLLDLANYTIMTIMEMDK